MKLFGKINFVKIRNSLEAKKLFVFGLVFALVGITAISFLRAGTPSAALETESGATTTNAQKKTDTTASANGSVQFGTPALNGFVGRSGTQLNLNGKNIRFVGFTAYEVFTLWSVNRGCGGQQSDQQLDDFFRNLRPNSIVRTSAFQMFAVNQTTRALDWQPFDRVLTVAQKYGHHMILDLASQAGDCDDGHWKDKAWYDGAYRQIFNDNGQNNQIMSTEAWVRAIVTRYKNNPTIAMWEPIGEPETSNCAAGFTGSGCFGHLSCPAGAAQSLRNWFDAIGSIIKSIDPNHLIGTSVIGGGQCGLAGTGYSLVHASPFVDVGSYHDYGADNTPVPPDLQTRINQLNTLNKPIITGETGIFASTSGACVSLTQRQALLKLKLDAQYAAGVRGIWLWNFQQDRNGCEYAITPTDPLLPFVKNYPLNQ